MNKYIAYYRECTFEGAYDYVIPFISDLNIKKIEDKLLDSFIVYQGYRISKVILGLPDLYKLEDVLDIEIYTLDDWFERNKVTVQ